MKKILALLALMLLLGGCSGTPAEKDSQNNTPNEPDQQEQQPTDQEQDQEKEEKSTTTVCRYEEEGMADVMTLVARGDRVTSTTEETIIFYADFDITEDEDKEMMKEMFEEEASFMQGYEGVDVQVNSDEETLSLIITIDLEVVDYDNLVDIGYAEESDTPVLFISLEISVNGFEADGYTCVTE